MAKVFDAIKTGILPTLAFLGGLAVLGFVVWFAVVKMGSSRTEIVNLWQPILAIVAVLMVIGLLAGAYSAFKLSSHSFALGLPNGSIRAIVALGFIVIFTAVSILLLSDDTMNAEYETIGTVQGLTEEEFSAYSSSLDESMTIIPERSVDADGSATYSGNVLRKKATQSGLDIAKQILTALITALSVISGFYFGSRTVETATNTGEDKLLVDATVIESAAGVVAKIDSIVSTLAAIEANVKERLTNIGDPEIRELVNIEYETITDQSVVAGEAAQLARQTQTQMAGLEDDSALQKAMETLDAHTQTAERALAQSHAAMGRVENLLAEEPSPKKD